MMSHVAASVVEFAKSQVEWMSDKVLNGLDMECGYSRELFLDWCGDSRNSFIITGRSSERTLCSKLIYMAECLANNSRTNRIVALEVKKRVRLEGAELEAYKKKKAQKDKEEARRRLEQQERRQAELRGYDSDDDDEMIASALAAVETLRTKKTKEEEAAAAAARGEKPPKAVTPMVIDVEPKEEPIEHMETNGDAEA
ncbi:unnamed protein product, partial [Cylicostephanus goldi]